MTGTSYPEDRALGERVTHSNQTHIEGPAATACLRIDRHVIEIGRRLTQQRTCNESFHSNHYQETEGECILGEHKFVRQ